VILFVAGQLEYAVAIVGRNPFRHARQLTASHILVDRFVVVDSHRSKLKESETAAVLPNPILAKQNRAFGSQSDCRAMAANRGRQTIQHQQIRDIHHALDAQKGALIAARDETDPGTESDRWVVGAFTVPVVGKKMEREGDLVKPLERHFLLQRRADSPRDCAQTEFCRLRTSR